MACTCQMLVEGSEASREPNVPSERPSGQKKEGPKSVPSVLSRHFLKQRWG